MGSSEEHREAVDTLVLATGVFCDVSRRVDAIIGDDALSVVTVEGFEGLGHLMADTLGNLALFEEYCKAYSKVDTWRQVLIPEASAEAITRALP